MYFRTKNFGIKDFGREIFESVGKCEAPVSRLAIGNAGVFIAQENTVVLLRGDGNGTRKIVKFDSAVTALAVDGDVVVCGDERGNVKVVGAGRSVLRHYREHEARVNEVKMCGTLLMSCSDDMKIKIFDISEEKSRIEICDNTDYVKSIDISDGMLFSGSYDGTVNGYDLQTFEKRFTHRACGPVSKVCCMDNRRIAYVCRNEVFAIDFDGYLLRGKALHTREVTGLLHYEKRLYTCSLDATITVLTTNLSLVSKASTKCGIMDFCISNDTLYLGLEDGRVLFSAGDRQSSAFLNDQESRNHISANTLIVGSQEREDTDFINEQEWEQSLSGNGWEPKKSNHHSSIQPPSQSQSPTSNSITSQHPRILNTVAQQPPVVAGRVPAERRLNRFEYKGAVLDAVKERDVQKLFGALMFVRERQALERVFSDLSKELLVNFLDVMIEFFNVQELIPVFIECIEMVLSMFERSILDDEVLSERMNVLASALGDEICFQEQNLRTISFLECFME